MFQTFQLSRFDCETPSMRHIPPGPPVLETMCSTSSTLRNYYSEKIRTSPGFRSISRVFCQLIWKSQDLQVTKVGRFNVDTYEPHYWSSVETLATWPGVERNG